MTDPLLRQQVMVLWLADSALDSQVIGWTFYDGAAPPGTPVPPVDPATPAPYPNGLEALRDGWRLLHMAALTPRADDVDRAPSFLRHEFVFERLVPPST